MREYWDKMFNYGTSVIFGQRYNKHWLKPLFVGLVEAVILNVPGLMVFQHLLVVEEEVALAVEDLADGRRIDLVIVATEPLVTVLPEGKIHLNSCYVIYCNPWLWLLLITGFPLYVR